MIIVSTISSFPRRRESSRSLLDSRLRGNDVYAVAEFMIKDTKKEWHLAFEMRDARWHSFFARSFLYPHSFHLISLFLIFLSLAFIAFPVHLGAAPSPPPAIKSGGTGPSTNTSTPSRNGDTKKERHLAFEMRDRRSFSSASTPSETSIIFEKAVNKLRDNNLKAARQGFEELIFNHSDAPETVNCYLYLGEIYEKQNLLYEATAIYQQFTQRYPGHQSAPEALIRQGEITLRLGEVKKAQKIFKQILFQYPGTSLKASFLLGDCLYASAEDIATARLYYDEGMKHLPQYLNDHPQTAFNIGHLAMEDKKFNQALSIFLALEKNYPQHELTSKAVTFCGDIYVKQGKISEAILAYQRVIDNYPGSIGALVSQFRMADLGVEHTEVIITNNKRLEAASTLITNSSSPFHAFRDPIWAYREIMQKKTADLVLVHLAEYKLGLALQKKGEHGPAVTVFQSLLEKAPEERIYQDCLYALKQELVNYLSQNFQKKDYLAVIKTYEENKDLLDSFLREEKTPLPYFEIAQSYQNLSFYPPAIRLYQKTQGMGVKDTLSGQISFRLGQIFFQTGEYQKAVDSLREIKGMGTDLKSVPIPGSTSNSPSLAFAALSLMGDVYWEKKDYTRSSLHYLASLAIQPLQQGQSIKQLLSVGQCYEKLGKTPEAIRSFSKAEDLAQKEKATSSQSLAEICLHLADCQYKIQEYTAALKTYQRVQSLSPKPEDRDWVLFQIGNCSLKKAEPKVAQDAFKKLKENNQDTIWPVVSDQWSEVSGQEKKQWFSDQWSEVSGQ